ncbi:hypothetical protein B0A52_07890, partial [Exophiala mesophila]
MDKSESRPQAAEIEHDIHQPQDVDPEKSGVQHVHAKTLVLVMAIVLIYLVQTLHLAGNGLLANTITSVTGGGAQSTWLVSCMAISAAALSPPISQAADYWGRKWFVVGFTAAGFVGCLISSRANTFGVLIGGQSIGCLCMGAQPLVHAIASEIIPRKYRSHAQAAVTAAACLGGIIGILIGGALVRSTPQGFRVFYYITAGCYAILAAIVTWLYNPPPRPLQLELNGRQKLGQLDWWGYLLFLPGLVLFSYALTSSSGVFPWSSPNIIGPLVVGAVLLVILGLYEWKGTRVGMLHHDLFSRGRNFAICLVVIFAEGIVFFAANTFYGYEVAVLYDEDLFNAGLTFTITFWTAILATVAAGFYVTKTKTIRVPLIVAMAFFVVFCATLASLNKSTPKNARGFAVFGGLGLGTALNALVVAAQLSTPPELIAVASGLMIGIRSFGGTVGLSIYSAIFSNTMGTQLPAKVLGATVPLGFDPQYAGQLLTALTSHDPALLEEIPGVTQEIIQAAANGVKDAYTIAFRYVWISAGAFALAAAILSCFAIDPKTEFNAHIDAPVETEVELQRDGFGQILLHHHNKPQ